MKLYRQPLTAAVLACVCFIGCGDGDAETPPKTVTSTKQQPTAQKPQSAPQQPPAQVLAEKPKKDPAPSNPDVVAATPPPELFIVLAQALAGDYQHSKSEAIPALESAERIAELQRVRISIARLDTDELDIESLAKDSSRAVQEMVTAIERVEALPDPPGWLRTSADSFMYYYRGVVNEDVSLEHFKPDEAESGRAEVHAAMLALLQSSRRLTALRLLLPDIAKRFAGPRTQSAVPILRLDFDDHHLNGPDKLSLHNASGVDLTNCTVVLQLNGKDGQVARNVHFINEWLANESVFSIYPPGIQYRGKRYGRRTVDDLRTIRFSVYCDQLACADVVYKYSASDRQEDGIALLRSLKFFGKYQPYEEGFIALTSTDRSVSVRYSGTQELRDVKLTLTLLNGSKSESRSQELDVWPVGVFESIEFPSIDWEARQYKATIKMMKSGAQHTVSWTRK